MSKRLAVIRIDIENAGRLVAVAQGTGGSYFFAGDREQLAGIYTELDQIETREVKVVSHRPRTDLFFWPLAAAVVASMVFHVLAALNRMLVRRRLQAQASPTTEATA